MVGFLAGGFGRVGEGMKTASHGRGGGEWWGEAVRVHVLLGGVQERVAKTVLRKAPLDADAGVGSRLRTRSGAGVRPQVWTLGWVERWAERAGVQQ